MHVCVCVYIYREREIVTYVCVYIYIYIHVHGACALRLIGDRTEVFIASRHSSHECEGDMYSQLIMKSSFKSQSESLESEIHGSSPPKCRRSFRVWLPIFPD